LVRDVRAELASDSVPRRSEQAMSELISAGLDYYRAVRDATSEAMFFQTFGSMFALTMMEDVAAEAEESKARAAAGRELVDRALASMDTGGYAAALARLGYLLARHGEPLPLYRLQLKEEMRADYAELLPDVEPAEWHRVRGTQEVIVRNAPEQALATLPKLLASQADRERLMALVERLMSDPRLTEFKPTKEQRAMVDLLRSKLDLSLRKRTARKAPAKRTAGRKQGAARGGTVVH
jgi:hypothetical protein